MANDKLTRLTRYVDDLKNKLTSPVPQKRAKSPETYKTFLRREIETHSRKIDELKLIEPVKK